jgi:voltage-gated potassium channel Kch
LAAVLLVGMVFYHLEEGWGWLDSLYFSVITLSTVGYGDFSPTTPLSKLFTMAYIFLGISIFVSFASMLAKERLSIHQKRVEQKAQTQSEAQDDGG